MIKFGIGGGLLLTKAIITSINRAGNRCIVRIPLFESASSTTPIEIEALVNITPGFYNNLFVNDVVFVAFEENAMEKPIILGKLYTGAANEGGTHGGAGILDTLTVSSTASLPATTSFVFTGENRSAYADLSSPKKLADYIKWLEKLFKQTAGQLDDNFKCFKNWTQFQLRSENVEIDDGDLDTTQGLREPLLYQEENLECKICGKNCTKTEVRRYLKPDVTKSYPDI